MTRPNWTPSATPPRPRAFARSSACAASARDTRDVYLNDTAYWRNIPANVWEYYIGGYQVIKKWLSYREQELLGRALRAEEAREVTGMARRLAAIVLMQPALDENYRCVKAHATHGPLNGNTGKEIRNKVILTIYSKENEITFYHENSK